LFGFGSAPSLKYSSKSKRVARCFVLHVTEKHVVLGCIPYVTGKGWRTVQEKLFKKRLRF